MTDILEDRTGRGHDMSVYYQDPLVTLYLGDALTEHTEWLDADVLLTDPPYGRNWKQGNTSGPRVKSDKRAGIAGDKDTTARDTALAMWGSKPAIAFGDLMLPPPAGTKLVAVYKKPPGAGTRGMIAELYRDLEAIYLINLPGSLGAGRTSLFTTRAPCVGNPSGIVARSGGHPHAKPADLLEALLELLPVGVVADPFAGSGSTLVAAKALGRRAVGVEIEERYAEMAARRLAQEAFTFDLEGTPRPRSTPAPPSPALDELEQARSPRP